MKKHILVVDDEQGVREICKDFLEEEGYRITLAVDGQDALEKMDNDDFDLYLIDMAMPKIDGFELMKLIKKSHPLAVIIVLTGFSSIEGAIKAVHAGAYQYLSKPINADELLKAVDDGLQYSQDLYGPLLKVFDPGEESAAISVKGEPTILRGFTPEEKIAFLDIGNVISFQEGDNIILDSDDCKDSIILVESGEVSVWLSNTTIDYLQKWDSWREESFIVSSVSETKLRAETDVNIKYFDRKVILNHFAGQDEKLLRRFIINLVNCNYLKWRKSAQRIVMLKLVTGER